MSENQAPARPSQVTMAGWMAVVGSALLVATLFDSMSRLYSVDQRKAIQEMLSTPLFSGSDVSVADMTDLLRVLTLVAGAAAAAATVLAVYALQRHNAARVGLTVAAFALLVTAPVTGGVLSVMVAAAATMLWSRPARDWFAGREPEPAPAPPAHVPTTHVPTTQNGAVMSENHRPSEDPGHGAGPGPGEERPRPTEGFGAAHPAHQPGPSYSSPSAYAPYSQAGYPPPSGDRRPATVTFAAVLTWLISGLTAVLYLVVIGMMLVAKDELLRLIEQDPQFQQLEGVSPDQLIAALWVISVIILVWCLVAIGLGVLAFRRQNWARITLAVSAGVTALLSVFALPVTTLNLLASAAVAVLLFTGGANQWYSRRPSYPSYPGPGGYGGPPGGYPGQPPSHPGQEPPRGDEQEPPKNVW